MATRTRRTKTPARRARRGRPPKGPAEPDRAERILEAADALFCAQGYDGVSIANVADAADVNKALVFYYYENKAGLFEAVLEKYYEAHALALKDAFEAEGPFRERLHRLIDAYLDFIESNQTYPRLVQLEVARTQSEHTGVIRSNMGYMLQWVEQTLGEELPAEGPLAPRQFFVTLSGLTINYYTYAPVLQKVWGSDPLAKRARDERRQHVHWVIDTLLDGVARGRAAR